MKNHFVFFDTPLADLHIIQHKPFDDNRGYLERLFCVNELQPLLHGKAIVQVNHTLTVIQGTVRGMHFQHPPHAETKLITCLRGEVFDVAVDLRHNSSTFLHWHAERLSANSHRTLLIPEGFAHGFQTLSNNCEMLYLHTAAYHPAREGGLNPIDPRLAVRWPMEVGGLSQRDSSHPFIDDFFTGIHL